MTSDEMKMEDITPEDLGCLGEQEIDPGVMEETQPIDKPVNPCFENIPFKKRKQFKKFWEEFFDVDARDMPFEDFCIEMYALQSPGIMRRALSDIVDQKHAGHQQKAAIDFNLTHRN